MSKKTKKSADDLLLADLRKIFGSGAILRFATWLKELSEKSERGGPQYMGWANSEQSPIAVWVQEQLRHELLDVVTSEPNGICVTYYTPFKKLGHVAWVIRFEKTLRKQFPQPKELTAREALESFEKSFVTKEI